MKNGLMYSEIAKISKGSFITFFPFLAMIIALLIGSVLGIYGWALPPLAGIGWLVKRKQYSI